MSRGTLYLLPNLLGSHKDHSPYLPPNIDEVMGKIDGLIAESDKEGRRYLSRFSTKKPALQIPIGVIKGKVSKSEVDFFLEPILQGQSWGLVSDAGLPCIADPGHQVVTAARKKGIEVKAFPGPCSMMLALMLSGFSGQRFAFHGYLPRESEALMATLKQMEKRAYDERATQIFMEAPYRNEATLEKCLKALKPTTHLCVASNLTLDSEQVIVKTIKSFPHDFDGLGLKRVPAVFLMRAGGEGI